MFCGTRFDVIDSAAQIAQFPCEGLPEVLSAGRVVEKPPILRQVERRLE